MNDDFEQEIRYRLLKVLSQDANLSQRKMAAKMGVSLGKVNFCLSELVKKGSLKINRFKDSRNKLQYLYVLTPQGIEEKARLTLSFLNYKVSEYNEIRRQIEELAREAKDQGLAGEDMLKEFDQTL